MEAYEKLGDEVSRLMEVIDDEEKKLKAEKKQVGELHESIKIAEQRTEQALNDSNKMAIKVSELQQEVDALTDKNHD